MRKQKSERSQHQGAPDATARVTREETNTKRLTLALAVFIPVLLISGVSLYYYQRHRQQTITHTQNEYNTVFARSIEVQKTTDEINKKVSEQQKQDALLPPPESATQSDKDKHYTSGLLYFLSKNDKNGAISYYVDTIVPSGIKISRLDIRENLVFMMANSEHKAELKSLIDTIIADYRAYRDKATDQQSKQAYDKIIEKYVSQKAKL